MESLWPLAGFAFVASITPGPNNVMLAASGVAFGLQRTVPHVLGVSVGFAVLTEAALFQFVNPKAWLMGLTAVSVFVPDMEPRWMAVGSVIAVFILVGFPCICTWAAAGATLRHWMSNARVRGAVSATIVVLMVYSVVGIWMTGG